MNNLQLFLPCAGGVEPLLLEEVQFIVSTFGAGDASQVRAVRGGVVLSGSWRDALALNLHSRLTQRVLVQLSHTFYREERDLYYAASQVAWETWFTAKQTFKIDLTSQKSPLKSLNFAALTIKDAVVDRFREKFGMRPSVDTAWPDVRLFVHLTQDHLTLYVDTSGEPLFKRGWREDKGDAPLKETLAAAMLAASGWTPDQALYDPCCGSGTIVIEAAQMAMGIAPGSLRRFGFEKLLPYQPHVWQAMRAQAKAQELRPDETAHIQIFGSDVAHRMVDFAMRNAQRAGVDQVVQLRGGDALQRMPPVELGEAGGKMVLNPPYGERIEVRGVAAQRITGQGRGEAALAQTRTREAFEGGDSANAFFEKLAAHWKKNFAGWTAHVLVPDMKLPSKMRLKESARVPMWNGPLECRLFRFDLVAGSAREPRGEPRLSRADAAPAPDAPQPE
jgi:putative N6-adenine-specific DNA methylase